MEYYEKNSIIERMNTTGCGLAFVVEAKDAENIGDIATVKNRNGTGIDSSNVVILFFIRENYMSSYENN